MPCSEDKEHEGGHDPSAYGPPLQPEGEVLSCPLSVVHNVEGTWDILISGQLPHPRLTQWTKGGAEEIVRLIDEAYSACAAISGGEAEYVRGYEQCRTDAAKVVADLRDSSKISQIRVACVFVESEIAALIPSKPVKERT